MVIILSSLRFISLLRSQFGIPSKSNAVKKALHKTRINLFVWDVPVSDSTQNTMSSTVLNILHNTLFIEHYFHNINLVIQTIIRYFQAIKFKNWYKKAKKLQCSNIDFMIQKNCISLSIVIILQTRKLTNLSCSSTKWRMYIYTHFLT